MVEAIVNEEPHTVFIDGPTGNIFVWILDRGRQFVGHMADCCFRVESAVSTRLFAVLC